MKITLKKSNVDGSIENIIQSTILSFEKEEIKTLKSGSTFNRILGNSKFKFAWNPVFNQYEVIEL